MKCAAISAILIIALAQCVIASSYRGQCRDTGNRCPDNLKALVRITKK
jgi:hypothetical protein